MTESRIGLALALGALAAMLSWAGCDSGSDGCTAAAEVCNGADDDCDGEVDEGFALGAACTAGVGACAASGARVCLAGAAACDAVPGEPAASETCDQVDEDCDGQTDEDVPGCCTPTATRACGAAEGACDLGTETCSVAGAWGPCLDAGGGPAVLPGTVAEQCNGIDDDCDGQTDEELSAPPCANQQGVCAGARMTCGGAAGWLACDAASYGPAYEAPEATCDGLDNDCDGATDEALLRTSFRDADGDAFGVGAPRQDCAIPGGWVSVPGDCDDTRPAVHPGAPELCNGLDDDCDGQTDESLDAPLCEKQAGVCAGAKKACGGASGWLACDASRYGPDYEAGELTCDYLDNDCDGQTDEGFPPGPCP